MAESREQRIARWANDRRFLQIVKAFASAGVRSFVYASDKGGVRHRLDHSTARAVCGAPIPEDAKVVFYEHATCVFCTAVT